MSTNGLLELQWVDVLMKWNYTATGIESISLPANRLWIPRFHVVNAVGDQMYVGGDTQGFVVVRHTGQVRSASAGVIKTRCELDIYVFPFDRQVCIMWIQSAHDGIGKVSFVQKDGPMEPHTEYRDSDEWSMIGSHQEYFNDTDNDAKTMSAVRFYLCIKRSSPYYVINVLLPSNVMAMLGLLVFLIPPEASEKIPLSITLVLAFAVQNLIVTQLIPRTSRIPLITMYITTFWMMTSFATAISTFAMNLYAMDQRAAANELREPPIMGSSNNRNNQVDDAGLMENSIPMYQLTNDVTPTSYDMARSRLVNIFEEKL